MACPICDEDGMNCNCKQIDIELRYISNEMEEFNRGLRDMILEIKELKDFFKEIKK